MMAADPMSRRESTAWLAWVGETLASPEFKYAGDLDKIRI
jgi:hypothetical protein